MTCGIYYIENKKDSKKYIGYSSNIESRWRHHRHFLSINKHDNTYYSLKRRHMLASEVVKRLTEIIENQGDGEVWLDVPDFINFISEFSIEDKEYQKNVWRNESRVFLVVNE